MDHELKQRLIGAVVVTALAAIFIPMLFDDPVDNRVKSVAETVVPPSPSESARQAAATDTLPASKQQVMGQSEPGLSVSEVEDDVGKTASAGDALAGGGAEEEAGTTLDSQGLQAKIAGLPANDPKASAVQETVPPEEESDLADDSDADPVAKPAKKAAGDDDRKAAAAKLEKQNAKTKLTPTEEKSKTVAEEAKKNKGKLTRWSLQAGSFSKKENAQAMVEKLRKQGLPASMVSKGNLYRIKIGPELDKAKAAEMKSKLAALKIQSYLQAE